MATFSATHWWSRWEVIEQVAIQFGDILPFLLKEGLHKNGKIYPIFTDPLKKVLLELEIATIIDHLLQLPIHWKGMAL